MIGTVFAIFIALALHAAAVKALALALLVLTALSFVREPRQTYGCFVSLILIGLLGRYPFPMMALAILMMAAALLEQIRGSL